VLARLCCFGCSLSDGERERERFLLESDSGIAGFFFSARFDQDSDMVWRAKASVTEKYTRREFGSGADSQENMGEVWGQDVIGEGRVEGREQ